ncbi:hypothetical protein NQ314_002843 [Rhamnusium bicolor]|uniref:SH3 domain-binding protein 5-like protein n=1 Tax=Rhamnusium bicolor TaxID=1586634 RepID=A0AAV8ZP33_9CUCU|nr:hypothetical protein NQ314_002843 [Rhamnusium bicolor]
MNEVDGDSSELDPRIQIELEKLNTTTDEINKLEIEYDEANTTFRLLLNESTRRLKVLSKQLGSCIEKARPYYELLEEAKKSQQECQEAAALYKKAHGIHAAAKETVALAEQRFLTHQHEWQFDNAWQEMLNHATMKVMEAENQKAEGGREHQRRAKIFKEIDEKLKQHEEKLQKFIAKSRPYFDEKTICQEQLNTQKVRIESIKKDIIKAKSFYSQTLKNLEQISNEIHMKRQANKGDNELLKQMPLKHYKSIPNISLELEKFNACSTTTSGSEKDEHEQFVNEIEDIRHTLEDVNIRPIEGKCEEIFVSEYHLGKLEEKLNH